MFTLVRATTPPLSPVHNQSQIYGSVFLCMSTHVEMRPISIFPPSRPDRCYHLISSISAVTTFYEIAMEGRGPNHWRTS